MTEHDGKAYYPHMRHYYIAADARGELHVIRVHTDNDAFSNGNLPDECERILRSSIGHLDFDGADQWQTIFDSNGNDVGRWRLKRDV